MQIKKTANHECKKKVLSDWLKLMSDQNNDCLLELKKTNSDDVAIIGDADAFPREILNVKNVQLMEVDKWMGDESLYQEMKSGTLHLEDGSTFKGWFSDDFQNRIGVLTPWSSKSSRTTTGRWTNGMLNGLVWIENEYGGYEETYFKNGVKNGPSRAFGPCPKRSDNLWHVCNYRNGVMTGQFWRGSLGGGYTTGVAENNEISGESIAYIFPNLEDAIFGQFMKGKLVSGKSVKISEVTIQNGIAVPNFSDPVCKENQIRDIATAYQISTTPLTPDSLEHSRVEVKKSDHEDAGEGLFAKIVFTAGDLVSILNGTRVVPSIHEDWSDYKVHFSTEFDIDIPDDMRRTDQYCSTLAHKANHSFTPNTKWGRMDHPKFGMVVTLLALRSITEGEEITVNYNYNLAIAPAWYKQCLAQFKNKVLI